MTVLFFESASFLKALALLMRIAGSSSVIAG